MRFLNGLWLWRIPDQRRREGRKDAKDDRPYKGTTQLTTLDAHCRKLTIAVTAEEVTQSILLVPLVNKCILIYLFPYVTKNKLLIIIIQTRRRDKKREGKKKTEPQLPLQVDMANLPAFEPALADDDAAVVVLGPLATVGVLEVALLVKVPGGGFGNPAIIPSALTKCNQFFISFTFSSHTNLVAFPPRYNADEHWYVSSSNSPCLTTPRFALNSRNSQPSSGFPSTIIDSSGILQSIRL